MSAVTLSGKGNQKLLKILTKTFERSISWNEYQTKSGNKNTPNGNRCFRKSNFLVVSRLFDLVYSNQGSNAKRYNSQRFYLPKDLIKNYNVVFNGKSFHDQVIDSDIK